MSSSIFACTVHDIMIFFFLKFKRKNNLSSGLIAEKGASKPTRQWWW